MLPIQKKKYKETNNNPKTFFITFCEIQILLNSRAEYAWMQNGPSYQIKKG